MRKNEKIVILIPCHNEEKGIGTVIDTVPVDFLKRMGFSIEIIVINNNSTDKTAHVAESKGARVIVETKKGKGNAILTGFRAVSSDTAFVVMLDGDNTYKSHEIPRLIEPLMNDFCDVIIGSRLSGKIKKHSLKWQNRVANWGYTFIVRHFYRANTTDVLSGFFAWKKEVVDSLIPHLNADGFELEMEMVTKMKRLGFEMYSVPITYDLREGETKVVALRDGIRILTVFFKNMTWTPKKENYIKMSFGFVNKIISMLFL